MPEIKNATIYRGTAPTLRFTMTTNGSISGWQTKFTIRKTETTPDPVTDQIDGSIQNAGSSSTPGVIDVPFTKAKTLALQARDYVYSLERVNAGAEDLLAKGTLVVEYDVLNPK